jgi:hypothetical protein
MPLLLSACIFLVEMFRRNVSTVSEALPIPYSLFPVPCSLFPVPLTNDQ